MTKPMKPEYIYDLNTILNIILHFLEPIVKLAHTQRNLKTIKRRTIKNLFSSKSLKYASLKFTELCETDGVLRPIQKRRAFVCVLFLIRWDEATLSF